MPIHESKSIEEEQFGLTRMTKASILKLCKKNKCYVTPHLNDVLYLHFQGFTKIECLEEYTGLKCLWLESNALSEICGLDAQPRLRCLFLHNNLIKKIEKLEKCRHLDTINLSNNYISAIENCDSNILPELTTLNIANNKIQSMPDFKNLSACLTLSVLDLSHNRIDDILIVGILAQMPELRVLMMTGNPVVSLIPMYRKTLINECKQLTYLDNRPVFDRDRACAVAWKRGGYEEEKKENHRWNRAEKKKIMDGVNATLRLRIKKALENGQEPTVELLEPSDDEDDNALENSTSSEITTSGQSASNMGGGDDIFDEVDNEDALQTKLYEDYNNIVENELLELQVETEQSHEEQPPATNRIVALVEINETENENAKPTRDSSEPIESESIELKNHFPRNAISFTESDIHTKRRMIIEQITQKPKIYEDDSKVMDLQFDSNLITSMAFSRDHIPDCPELEPTPNGHVSNPPNPSLFPNPSDDQNDPSNEKHEDAICILKDQEVAFEDHVGKIAKTHRDVCETHADDNSEPDDDYGNDYDDIDSFTADIGSQKTLRGFLTEYNEFIDTMQSKLSDSQKTIDGLNKNKLEIDYECDQLELSHLDQQPDLDNIHHNLVQPSPQKKKTSYNPRMMPRQVPLFDMSLADINNELEVLGDNVSNSLSDMVDRIYRNRDAYGRDDELETDVDEPITGPDFIKNYYAEYCGFEKASTEGSTKALNQLNLDTENQKRARLQFYCNNLDNFTSDEDQDESLVITEETFNDKTVIYDKMLAMENHDQICSEAEPVEEVIPTMNNHNELNDEPGAYVASIGEDLKDSARTCDALSVDIIEEEITIEQTVDNDSDECVELASMTQDNCFNIAVEDIPQENIENTLDDKLKLDQKETSINSLQKPTECNLTDEEVARISRIEYIQSILFSGPQLADIVAPEPFFKAGDFGLDAEGAQKATDELKECAVHRKHMQRLEALDRELDANINRIILDASIECDILSGLEQYGDPCGDNQTDIYERAHKYCAEFKERVKNARNEQTTNGIDK